MAGLCEGGNEPPGSLKASKVTPPPTGRPPHLNPENFLYWVDTKRLHRAQQRNGYRRWGRNALVFQG
ncbi:hypothetical protein ANN_25309 [Periplaneta americana]|uniref:Uncharacterized protein n=1 Tax=Periplaneta americana TaxID=6978 RepID=A0ABQ8S0Z5_PERAM|nr:hypothetical protein ANN_25309 [Periplaneta americana]